MSSSIVQKALNDWANEEKIKEKFYSKYPIGSLLFFNSKSGNIEIIKRYEFLGFDNEIDGEKSISPSGAQFTVGYPSANYKDAFIVLEDFFIKDGWFNIIRHLYRPNEYAHSNNIVFNYFAKVLFVEKGHATQICISLKDIENNFNLEIRNK